MTSLRDLVVRLLADSSGLVKGFDDASRKTGTFEDRMGSAARSARGAGLAMSAGLTAPLAGLGFEALKTAADFEGGMNLLQAVTGASAEEMKRLSDRAIALGADMSLPATSAVDAGEAMLELSKAGLSVEQTMNAARGVLQLSAAANISNASAAEIAANALNSFKLPGEKAADVANMLANAANASSIEITDAADSLKMASAVFSAFQSPVVGAEQAMSDLVTSIGLLGNAGIKGSDAGTSLKQAMLQLTGPSGVAEGKMQAVYAAALATANGMELLGSSMDKAIGANTQKERNAGVAALNEELKQAGIEVANTGGLVYDADGKMRSFTDIMRLAEQGTRNMTDAQRNEALTTIFGADATRAAIILMDQLRVSTDEGASAFANMEVAVNKSGGAADLANARTKGLNGAIEGLKSVIETTLLTQGTPFLGFFTDLIQKVGEAVSWFGSLPAPVQQGALALGVVAAVAGPLLLILPGLVAGVTALGTVMGVLAAGAGLVSLPVLAVVAALAALAAILTDAGGIRTAAWDAGAGLREGIGHAISWTKDRVNELLNALRDLAGRITSMPRLSLPSLPRIPGFAGGVTNFGGGLALVGERGPELVSLPRGSNVYPSGTGPAGAAGGGNVYQFFGDFYGLDHEDQLVSQLERADRRGRR